MTGFASEPPRASTDEHEHEHDPDRPHHISCAPPTDSGFAHGTPPKTEEMTTKVEASQHDASAGQKMLSAVSGSLLTSLLGKRSCPCWPAIPLMYIS